MRFKELWMLAAGLEAALYMVWRHSQPEASLVCLLAAAGFVLCWLVEEDF